MKTCLFSSTKFKVKKTTPLTIKGTGGSFFFGGYRCIKTKKLIAY